MVNLDPSQFPLNSDVFSKKIEGKQSESQDAIIAGLSNNLPNISDVNSRPLMNVSLEIDNISNVNEVHMAGTAALKTGPTIWDRIDAAHTQYNVIQNLWTIHEEKILERSNDFYREMDSITSHVELIEAHNKYYTDMNGLRVKYNEDLKICVSKLEMNLDEISKFYNQLNEKERPELEKAINKLNSTQMKSHMTTSSQHAMEYKIVQFQGIVEREYNIKLKNLDENTPVDEQLKLIKPDPLSEKKRGQLVNARGKLLNKIKNSKNEHEVKNLMEKKKGEFFFSPLKWLFSKMRGIPRNLKEISEKLAKRPSREEMEALKNQLQIGLKKDIKTLSSLDAMKTYVQDNDFLAWGEPEVAQALTNPAHWVNKYDVALTISAKGTCSLYETSVKPLNIEKDINKPSGYGSMMRAEGARAANAQKTEFSIVTYKGNVKENSQNIERFRIGQLPTVDAAVDALEMILKNSSEKVTVLHDNMLLTATQFTDKKIASQHKQNLLKAFDQLDLSKINTPEGVNYEISDIENLKKNYMQTNFGVNEGAVGTLELAGVALSSVKLGWERSFKEFNNDSAIKYNSVIKDKFDGLKNSLNENLDRQDLRLLGKLGAIVQIGQELEEIWFKEDYKNPEVGANQFKAPALLGVLDSLLGFTVNTHCKSAKDRASIVEAHSLEMLQSIEVNYQERQKELREKLGDLDGRDLSKKSLDLIYSGALTVTEILEILNKESVENLLISAVSEKIDNAKKSLGVNANNGFLLPKPHNSKIRRKHLRGLKESSEAAKAFEQAVPTSIYKTWSFDPTKETSKEDQAMLIEVQREKKQRRLACRLAMDITKENTGIPGDKLKHGEPLRIFYSGFHRDYVRNTFLKIGTINKKDFENEIIDALGLDEITDKIRVQILKDAWKIKSLDSTKEQLKLLNKLIKKVEKIKYKQFYPMTSVES